MLTTLVSKVLHGPDRHLGDARTGLKVVKVRDNLIIYRNGARKLWVDLEMKLVVAWCLNTQAEVKAFNHVLKDLAMEDFYEFVRTKRVILLNAGGKFYRSEDYDFRYFSRDHGTAGRGLEPA